MKKKLSTFLFLTGLVFLVYGNTWSYSFHFDDVPSILEKPWIRGLDKIPQFIFSLGQRPLVILSFNLNYAISGFEVWSYHLFNIAFHALAACLVYCMAGLAQTFIGRHDTGRKTSALPLLAALIFALHPLQTQSVTYISSRSSVLATLFYLAALIVFFKAMTGGKTRLAWAGTATLFLLGLLTKPIIVTLPAMLFLFHYYFCSQESTGDWLKKQGKWIVGMGLCVLSAILYQHFLGGGIVKAQADAPSVGDYALTQTLVIPLEYFRKMLFPFNLSIDSDFPAFQQWGPITAWSGTAILLLCIGVWVAVSLRKAGTAGAQDHARWIGFGMAWTGITFLPTSSILPLLDYSVEHHTYLPMVGFSIVLAALLCKLLERVQAGNRPGLPSIRPIQVSIFLMLALFAVGTAQRNTVWENEVTLWSDAKKKAPWLTRPYNNLGEAYDKQGKYDLAIAEFDAAIKLAPTYFFALNNLGNVYGKKKDFPQAIVYFERALKEKPDYPPALYNLAKAQHLTGKVGEAMESYRKAIQSNPYFEEAYYNLAFLALQMGNVDESMQNFQKFLEMQPNHAKARYGLGNAYAAKRDIEHAIAEYQKAVEIDPAFIAAQVNLATLQWQTGNVDAALARYEDILAQHPEAAGIHKNLGLIYSQNKSDPQKAAFHFKEYARLLPNAPDAQAVNAMADSLMGK